MTDAQLKPDETPAPPKPRRWRRPLLLAVLAALALVAWVGGQNAWRHLQRRHALRLAQEGRFAEAEPLLRRALEQEPRDVEVLRALARGCLDAGKLVDADSYLTTLGSLQPGEAKPHLIGIKTARMLGHREVALEHAHRLLDLQPENCDVRRQAAELLLALGRLPEAEAECRRCLERQPGDVPVSLLLERVYHTQGQDGKAQAVLDALARDHPRSTAVLMAQGVLYADTNQPERAIPLLREVMRRDAERQPVARYHLSQALARTGQPEEALRQATVFDEFQAAERLSRDSRTQPANVPLQIQAAEALLKVGRSEEAVGLLRKVLERDPNQPDARRLLAGAGQRPGEVPRP